MTEQRLGVPEAAEAGRTFKGLSLHSDLNRSGAVTTFLLDCSIIFTAGLQAGIQLQ
jgi:hypothetical protein